MVSTKNDALLTRLRTAEAEAWKAVNGNQESREVAHRLIADALRMAEAASQAPPCTLPTCDNPVEYSGSGRPALYCSRRCRDRAAYAARRQRKSSCMTDDDQDPVLGIS
jgi:endogenous inhibitor of DNA gyrase (YacG/DUF329 family)